MNLAQLYAAEPKLRPMIVEAKKIRTQAARDPFVNVWVHYSRFKAEVAKLVGWQRLGEADDPLTTPKAYEVAIRALSDALGV